jgi:hypothetical protein
MVFLLPYSAAASISRFHVVVSCFAPLDPLIVVFLSLALALAGFLFLL